MPTDRVVHETKNGRELGTVKWVGAWVGRKLQSQADGSVLFGEEKTAACEEVFTDWKRRRLTDMRERDRDDFVAHCHMGYEWPCPGPGHSPGPGSG